MPAAALLYDCRSYIVDLYRLQLQCSLIKAALFSIIGNVTVHTETIDGSIPQKLVDSQWRIPTAHDK